MVFTILSVHARLFSGNGCVLRLNTRQTFPVAVGPAWQDQPYVHDGLITWVQIVRLTLSTARRAGCPVAGLEGAIQLVTKARVIRNWAR